MKSKIIYNDAYKLLIFELKETRKNLELKQEDLAKLLKKDQKYISRVERFDKQLNIQEIWEICFFLKMDFIELLNKYDKHMKRSMIDV